jgi:DNA-binding CsgD family transcriptional regulator
VQTIDNDDGGAARLILPTLESVRATLSRRFGDVLVAVTALADAPGRDGTWSVIDCIRCGDAWCLVTRLSPAPAGTPKRPATGLSNRERVIAAQVAGGAPLKVVAATLSISTQAVATHLSRAKRKLGVSSRAELVRAVILDGSGSPGTAGTSPAPALFEFIWNGTRLRVLPVPRAPAPPFAWRLTDAELDVLIRVAYGMTNAQIARTCGTAATTVAAQISAIMHKVGVSSRAKLLALFNAG